MTTSWQSEGTVIGRLRIRMPADNAMTSQHNIATVIRNADLRPSRLPASAILCLRRLRDPSPSVRWSGHDRIHPPAEWERSAVAELDRMASVAMRPVLSAVPPSAESVVFIDRAEMLACLALDWLRGDLRTNWWWATLLRQAGAETTILHEWMSSPEFIPLALEHLAARSQAVSFAKKIDDHFAAGLLSRVLYAFGIQEPRAPLDFREVEDTTATTRSFTEGQISAGTQDLPPWSAIVPEAVASLSPVQQVLLGQGLMLRRAPFIVRSEAFQRAVAEWRERAQRRTHHSVRIPTTRIAALRQGPTPGAIPTHIPSAGQTVAADSDLTRMVAGAVRVENEKERVPNQATTRPSEEEAQSPKPAITIKPFSLPDVAIAKPQADVEGLSTRYLEFKDLSSDVSLTALPHTIVSAAQFNSDLAGTFFLINVALALGLYSDFTAPRGANLELDLWEFLYLLASALIPAEMLEDPVGPLLLTLAGNDVETPPGSRFLSACKMVSTGLLARCVSRILRVARDCARWTSTGSPSCWLSVERRTRCRGRQQSRLLGMLDRLACGVRSSSPGPRTWQGRCHRVSLPGFRPHRSHSDACQRSLLPCKLSNGDPLGRARSRSWLDPRSGPLCRLSLRLRTMFAMQRYRRRPPRTSSWR